MISPFFPGDLSSLLWFSCCSQTLLNLLAWASKLPCCQGLPCKSLSHSLPFLELLSSLCSSYLGYLSSIRPPSKLLILHRWAGAIASQRDPVHFVTSPSIKRWRVNTSDYEHITFLPWNYHKDIQRRSPVLQTFIFVNSPYVNNLVLSSHWSTLCE